MTITNERLAELKRIAEAASPGPWRYCDHGEMIFARDNIIGDALIADIRGFGSQGTDHEIPMKANGEHIAAFDPPTVLSLLAEIERLKKEASDPFGTDAAIKKTHAEGYTYCSCGEPVAQDSCPKCGAWHDIYSRR